MRYHKHEGVMSKGKLKSHPIEQVHKDRKVQEYHNKTIKVSNAKPMKVTMKKENKVTNLKNFFGLTKSKAKEIKTNVIKQIISQTIEFPIDGDGYIVLDLDKTETNGLRLMFTRTEGRVKRNVSIQIENEN